MIECMTKVLRALDDVSDRAKRTKLWLENEPPAVLAAGNPQARPPSRAGPAGNCRRLSQGRDLPSSKCSSARPPAPWKRPRKKSPIKKWQRDFDPTVAPLQRPVDRMRDYLAELLPKGILSLMKAAESLDSYRHTVLTSGAVPRARSGRRLR